MLPAHSAGIPEIKFYYFFNCADSSPLTRRGFLDTCR